RVIFRAMGPRFCAAVLALLVFFAGESNGSERVEAPIPIRIGWQIPAATQAQIVQVLKRTNLLESHGLEPSLVPFSFGTPEIEAALAGELDVVFAGDQPVINLIARGGQWKIVARLYYDRAGLMVPPKSPIRALKDLRGKTVASPFGSIAHRVAILKQRAVGLDPDRDVRNVNLDLLEIRRRVLAGGVATWGTIDAVAVWEPSVSIFELGGLARSLSTERALGVVAVSDDFIANHPEAVVQLLAALMRAWTYLAQHFSTVSQWYIDDTQLGYTREALASAAKIDPNWRAKSLRDIDLRLTEALIAELERGAAWRYERDVSGGSLRIRQAVDQSLLAQARKIIAEGRFENAEIILPPAREVQIPISESRYFFDVLPLWVVFTLMVLVALLAIEAGQWLGLRRRRSSKHEPEGPVGTAVAAVLALLAFMIALTFGAASNRFDARKEALLDETNAIGTAYLRAGLLPEPHRTTTRNLLRDYVEMRIGMVEAYGEPERLQTIQARTASLQDSIWSHAEGLAEERRNSPIYALFTSALNEVFDLHTKRVVLGAEDRIPLFVWIALILVSCVAMMAVGFQFGIAGRRSLTAELALSLTFTLVMLLIFDLDRPGRGLIEVNQQPMMELHQSLSKPR
ncbi:MAG: NrtA/SsuA/CpmA family ABC transporter substrate-binding protein, partial [Gammaproteobacteria bacterium]